MEDKGRNKKMLGKGCFDEGCFGEQEDEEEDEEFLILIKEISREEYKEYMEKSITKNAKDIKDKAEIIIEDFSAKESIGSFFSAGITLPKLGELMIDYSASRSEEKTAEKRWARGEEVQRPVYYRDPSGKARWVPGDSEIAHYLREVRNNEEEKEEDKIMYG